MILKSTSRLLRRSNRQLCRVQTRSVGFEMGEDTRILWNYFYGGPGARNFVHMDNTLWQVSLWPVHCLVCIAYSMSFCQVMRSLLFDPEVFWNINCTRDSMYWSKARIDNGQFNHWGPHKYRVSHWETATEHIP